MSSRPDGPRAPSSPRADLDQLVARAQRGDRQALAAVLAAVAPSIHRFGVRMCRNVHDAEDVLQDTLLNVAKHIGEFEGRSTLSSWVFALARSACSRKRRGLKNQPPISDEHLAERSDPRPSPEARAEEHELVVALDAALGELSEDHREVILLRDVEGLSATEAAGVLGVSVDALKSRLHRAREALRASLRPKLEPVLATPRRSASCPDIVAAWSKKLEGDLSQGDCAEMERHIEGCAGCGAACDALRSALDLCQHVAAEDVPPEVQARVRAAVQTWAHGAESPR